MTLGRYRDSRARSSCFTLVGLLPPDRSFGGHAPKPLSHSLLANKQALASGYFYYCNYYYNYCYLPKLC